MYKLHVGELAKGISDERNEGLVEVCLQALAAVEAWDKGVAVSDKLVCFLVLFVSHCLEADDFW